MRFSERIGQRPVKDSVQLESMDADLRNGLWNVVHLVHLRRISYRFRESPTDVQRLVQSLYLDFFKWQVDQIPGRCDRLLEVIKTWFYRADWYEVYDFVEFVDAFTQRSGSTVVSDRINQVLEREVAGYRFLSGTLTPITNDVELVEIQDAIDGTAEALRGVNAHLKAALSKLSDKQHPDYRNSVKESISAVESIAGRIAGKENASLGEALRAIEDKVGLHPALKRGFSALFGYTSNDDGIRHALQDEPTVAFEDAKYMLVSCSAFVNYLVAKASKSGLDLSQRAT